MGTIITLSTIYLCNNFCNGSDNNNEKDIDLKLLSDRPSNRVDHEKLKLSNISKNN